MRYFKIEFLFFLLFLCCSAFSQNDTVRVKLTVTDGFTKRGLQGVSVINRKSGDIIVTDINGHAEVRINKQDALYLFLSGYHSVQFSLADSVLKSVYVMHLAIEPFSTGLKGSVIIKAPKTLDNIAADRQNLGVVPKEVRRTKFNPLYSPIDALYEAVNKRTQEKKKLGKEIAADDKRKVFKELLNYYNEKKLIDLPEEQYDDFIDFCNFPDGYLKSHSDYELMSSITLQCKKYTEKKGLLK
jgi:hypothetical protein